VLRENVHVRDTHDSLSYYLRRLELRKIKMSFERVKEFFARKSLHNIFIIYLVDGLFIISFFRVKINKLSLKKSAIKF